MTSHEKKCMPEVHAGDRGQALVVGGGLAGLLTARVLADHFDRVIILERDRYPACAEPRNGIPQARHVHILLMRGRQILETLFPGLTNELVRRGAQRVDTSEEMALLNYHGWSVRYQGAFAMLTFTRPLLDHCLRRRLAECAAVTFREGYRVVGLTASQDGRAVTGARYRRRDGGRRERILHGDFVVDATGRFSRAPDWLASLGYERPEEVVVNPFLGYATRMYEPPAAFDADWKALVLLGSPPDESRGGVLLPVEGGRWLVTLAGIGRDYPPTDDEGFLTFARTLRSSVLYESIRNAEAVTAAAGYRATANRLRRYEAMSRWPKRFAVLGDAVCALNPIYAQGMTVTAMGVMTLKQMLSRKRAIDRAQSFQRELARINRTPWLMATADDFRWPVTEGRSPRLLIRLQQQYLDGVIALATERPAIGRAFSEVAHLLKPPQVLLRPHIALRVLARALDPRSALE